MPLIDLHARSIELYETMGKTGCDELSPLKKRTTTKSSNDAEAVDDQAAGGKVYDGTHLNAKGSAIIGRIVAEELSKAMPDLAVFIKPSDGK